MVDEEIFAWITKRCRYWHLAGCYMQYIVVTRTIWYNGSGALILYFLEIEMFTILLPFHWQMRESQLRNRG